MFRKIKVEINRVVHRFTAEEVKKFVLDNIDLRDKFGRIEAERDELRWKLKSAEERLEQANAKLKNYGHPGV